MLILKALWHVVAYFAYRFFSRDYALRFYTQWVENQRDTYQRTQKFSVVGSGMLLHGEGWFGEVYLSPCRRFALKKSQGDSYDAGYGYYLQLILKHQGNPYVPKVYAHIQVGDSQVVLMERLFPLRDSVQAAQVHAWRSAVKSGTTQHCDPTVKPVLDDLHALVAEGHHNDLRPNNVMRRKLPRGSDGKKGQVQLVITDPIS